jgi:type I restriction enzyme S subunit
MARLDELCEINPPRPRLDGVADTTEVLFVPMAAVDEHSGRIEVAQTSTVGSVGRKSYRSFSSGDVLFAKITPCMENGKAAVVPSIPGGLGFGSTEFHVLRPKPGTDARLIWHLVRQKTFRDEAAEHFTGTVGQLRVPADFLRSCEALVPTRSQDQAALASFLDGVISTASTASNHLTVARSAVERLRRAVLAAACSGRLTADWRDESGAAVSPLLVSTAAPGLCEERLLPPNWVVARVADIGVVQLGGTPSRKRPEYWNREVRWVSSGEVANCRIASTREGISQLGLGNSSAKVYPIGTVLIAMIGEGKTRGQAAILDIEAATNQNVAGILADRRFVNPEYLWRWTLAEYETTRAAGMGGNQPALNKQRVADLVVPIPPLDEQDEIVRRVDHLLQLAEAVRSRIDAASQRLEHSSEAVLAKAFRGELLPNGASPSGRSI